MTEFQELIKNFDKIRDYMRQFYICGFKVRNDFQDKSPRAYDNERRRIESWLSDHTRSDYTSKGKHVYISVGSKSIFQNPLHAAWKSRSFTDNDLMLHFFILDQLVDAPQGMTASALCDEISRDYGVVFDIQTLGLKLKEYESLGILCSEKSGRNLVHRLVPLPYNLAADPPHGLPHDLPPGFTSGLWPDLITAMEFFQGATPFGFIGSTVLDQEDMGNRMFQFKHQFIVHTLGDGTLAQLLDAVHRQCSITHENKSSRSNGISTHSGIPLKIFVNTQTGRRYLCMYLPENRRFNCARLDSIQKVNVLEPYEAYDKVPADLNQNVGKCWGVSFGSGRSRLEEIHIKLYIDEEKEPYILNRLYREGRGGEVMRIRENQYLYTGVFFDTNEMLSWVKTFTGRVLDIQGTSQFAIAKIVRDWEEMYEMYCIEETEAGEEYGTVR